MDQFLEMLRAALAEAKSLADIETALAEFASGLGYSFQQLAWLRQPPSAAGLIERPRIIGNIPAEWVERYWQRRYYEDDCIARACLQSVLPVSWTASPTANLTDRQRRIAREAARFGLAQGIAVTVRGPGAWLAVMTVARFRAISPDALSKSLDTLTLGAVSLTAVILDQIASERSGAEMPSLKSAECSCMLWAARGKSTAEIGTLLGMPERTVYFHIGNAMDRLGVASRVQAVAEAIKAGLIAP